MKWEARFVYCFWKMLDQEVIEVRELKEIVYMIHERDGRQLRESLEEVYGQENVSQFTDSWRLLKQDRQYYKAVDHKEKLKTSQKNQKTTKKFQQNALKQIFLNNPSSPSLNLQTCYSPISSKQVFLPKNKEKDLINRLYTKEKYIEREVKVKQNEERRVKQEIENCTFKPQLSTSKRGRSKSIKSVSGYQKAVKRMKTAQYLSKIDKEKKDYIPRGQNYEKMKSKEFKPPTFLNRSKNKRTPQAQFIIEFEVNKHKIKLKIHESDSSKELAANICKIYNLKQNYFSQISRIISSERDAFLVEHSKSRQLTFPD